VNLDENLDRVLSRHQELEALMSSSTAPAAEEFAKLSKEYADLSPVVEAISGLREAKQEISDLAAMIADAGTDAEMKAMAEEEFLVLKAKIGVVSRHGRFFARLENLPRPCREILFSPVHAHNDNV